MRRALSGQAMGAALLVVGLAIGAGLVYVTTYVNGVPTKSVTLTTTQVSTSVTTQTTTETVTETNPFGGSVGVAQVSATVTSCQWSGTHEYCEVGLTNSGSIDVATTGACSLDYGGQTYGGYTGPSLAAAVSPGASQQIVVGGSVTGNCQGSSGGAAVAGVQVTGTISLENGGEALFSGTAS